MSALFKEEAHLRDYIDVVSRRRWPMIALFIVVVGLAAAYFLTTPKVYTAKTRILVEPSPQRIMSFDQYMETEKLSIDFYGTQFKMVESRTLAETVVRRLKLYRLPEFGAPPPQPGPSPRLTAQQKKKAISKAAGKFMKKTQVKQVRGTRLADISFTSLDPVLAARTADALAQAFIDFTLERKLKISGATVAYLGKRIEEQRRRLEASQLALQKYMEEKKLSSEISGEYQKINAARISQMKSDLLQVQTKRSEAGARLQQARRILKKQADPESIPDLRDSEVVKQVRTKQVELANLEAQLSSRYGARHPKMVALKAEKKALARQLRREVNTVMSSLQNHYEILRAKEKILGKSVESLEEEAIATRKRAMGYMVLQREVSSNAGLYDMLLTRAKEAQVTQQLDVGNVMILDLAQVPGGPSWPKPKIIIILAVVGGFLLALVLGFTLEYLDNTLNTPDQIENMLKLPSMGLVPFSANVGARVAKKGLTPKVRVAPEERDIAIDEAFRALRTAVTLSRAAEPPRVLTVTSALHSEGKSFTSANLARVYAEAGERTLLIEGDMRKPSQHRIWHLNREVGLSSVLTGTATLQEAIKPQVVPNLDLLLAGPIPPNPPELLQSDMMKKALQAFRQHYSVVIIDSPPVLPITDAVIISHMADKTLLVAAANASTIFAIQKTIETLSQAGADLMGVVLNRTRRSRWDYYHYGSYSYKYQYRYGYGEEKSHRSKAS
jgi:polysaccharide biosynthesis transport protein